MLRCDHCIQSLPIRLHRSSKHSSILIFIHHVVGSRNKFYILLTLRANYLFFIGNRQHILRFIVVSRTNAISKTISSSNSPFSTGIPLERARHYLLLFGNICTGNFHFFPSWFQKLLDFLFIRQIVKTAFSYFLMFRNFKWDGRFFTYVHKRRCLDRQSDRENLRR